MKKQIKGFTLIELIVVIAIIGVLALILVPSMLGFVEQARASKMNANAKSVYSGVQLAMVDYVNAGYDIQPDCIYIGADDSIGYPEGGGAVCDLTNYLGEEFGGYFAFRTDDSGTTCAYALWSEKPLTAALAGSAMTDFEVRKSTKSNNPTGCYPLKQTAANT